MEEFTYTNIFATKGIEYIIIIAFFATLIPFRLLLKKKKEFAQVAKKSPGFITANMLRIPQGVFFSKYHTWAHLEKNGEATVGLDDLLIHITGEVKLVTFKNMGDQIKKGELLAKIKHNGYSLDVLSPVTGEIISTNKALNKNPELVKLDPYQQGWIYSLKPTNWKTETNSYYLAEDATSWAISELERFKDFLAVSSEKTEQQPLGVVMQDGGEIIEKPLANMPKEVWDDFQKSFLS